jgi:hypothetical protein
MFKKGQSPWNKGKSGLQTAWNKGVIGWGKKYENVGFQIGHKNFVNPEKLKGRKPVNPFKNGEPPLPHKKECKCFRCEKKTGNKNINYKDGMTKRDRKIKSLELIAGRKKPEQCELCGSIGSICFDHEHKTDKFRGWIFNRCNLVLGLVKDNRELLNDMIEYLNSAIVVTA